MTVAATPKPRDGVVRPAVKQDHIETHFPILMMEREFEGASELNRHLAELVLDFERTRETWRPNDPHQYNAGFSTDIDLFDHPAPALQTFRGMIEETFFDYLHVLKDRGLLGLSDETLDGYEMDGVAWAVILRRHEWICPHSHEGGAFAGTYYVRLPPLQFPEGCLEFVNPLGRYSSDPLFATSATLRRHPREGVMLLFPSHYIHLVYPFVGNGERISFSFTLNTR